MEEGHPPWLLPGALVTHELDPSGVGHMAHRRPLRGTAAEG